MNTNPPRVRNGNPFPLGATWTGDGVNVALFSEGATRVDLCLFDAPDAPAESARIPLPERTGGIWHGFFPDLRPGQAYGFRVEGPYQPERGRRFNPRKLLLDPYAKAVAGELRWDDALFGFTVGGPEKDLAADDRDSAPFMPKAVVVDPAFDWEGTAPLGRPLAESTVYEVHVKGFSQQWGEIPESLRGTYAAVASDPAIAYFKRLGITAVELLPVHQFVHDRFLVEQGRRNYWGYNSLGFFAPHADYASADDRGGQVREFKEMVKRLHRAGIEVILDVVYNHTAEGNEEGATLSFRGIENAAYYRLREDDPRRYLDFTGCGNSVNTPHPDALALVMDSLRYWAQEMHVDGFRFDLASTLAREAYDVSRFSSFLAAVHQDPVLARVKLIAEPWDLGEGGYQVGSFPPPWSEWNGKYRDAIRSFWKGDPVPPREMAARLAGSPDLYAWNGRRPQAGVNFITAHDGFTLRDLVSYNDKHNLANGEENRDGDNRGDGWNCGAEGPTDDPAIEALRRRQQRNFLATLLLSQGVPMLTAGDEYGRTQEGNNNAYCQDTPLAWLAWERDAAAEALTGYVGRLAALRRDHPAFRRPKYFPEGARELTWFCPDGKELTDAQWPDPGVKSLGMLLRGDSGDVRDGEGNPVGDDTFLLWLNGYPEATPHVLPGGAAVRWEWLLDTAEESGFPEPPRVLAAGETVTLPGRSVALFRQSAGAPAEAGLPPKEEKKEQEEAKTKP